MNKKLLVGMFSAFMAMVPLTGYADQTIDSPHVNVDSNGGSEDCTYCHFANYQPSDCVRCHSNNNAPYGDGTAPLVSTHKNLDCQACHNPHVSLQAAGIAGAYTGISANTPSVGMTTLTGVTPTPDVSWAEKTGPERGMILWIANGTDAQGNPQSASFEIKGIDATAGTVTVKGDVPVASGNFDLRRGQLIAKKVTKTAASSYRQGDLPVEFPSQGSTSIFIDTVNATPTGVCQVCHTTTAYWKNDGSGSTHNAGLACTQCHKHSSGFLVTGCTACHPGTEPDGAPTVFPGQMASPSTGSQTAGQHLIHATDQGYNFPCGTCHYGTGMDRINDPTNPVKGDGIQIGFNWGTFMGYLTSYNGQATVDGVAPHATYVGTNHTTVTNTGAVGDGSLTCSNVYCHSDGTAIRRGCGTAMTNTSPAWDGSSADPQGDTVKCNNCHGYTTAQTNVISTGKHTTHVQSLNIPCYACHGDTVIAGGDGEISTDKVSVLNNKTNHANAVYNIKGSGTYYGTPLVLDPAIASGTGNWNATTKNCTVTCHNYQRNWTANDTGSCPDPCSAPGAMTNVDPIMSGTVTNLDPNTLMIVDTSVDTDRNDLVKNFCQGGGHKEIILGTLKYQTLDTIMGNYDDPANLDGQAHKPYVKTYRPSQVDTTTDPLAPRVFYNYAAIDNGLESAINATQPDFDGNGVTWAGWAAHVLQQVDLPHTNTHPIMDYTIAYSRTTASTCSVIITDLTVDPDAADPAKQAYFGSGHDAPTTKGYARLTFVAGQGVNSPWVALPLDGTPTTVTGTANAAVGGRVWYMYQVRDNHSITPANAIQPSYMIYSGWKRTPALP